MLVLVYLVASYCHFPYLGDLMLLLLAVEYFIIGAKYLYWSIIL